MANKIHRTKLLKHREDWANLARMFTCFPFFCLPAITGIPNTWIGFFYCTVIWFLLNDMNFLLHQHVHNQITTSPRLNWGLDLVLSTTTGMSAYNWRQHHILRHHQGSDDWRSIYCCEVSEYSWFAALTHSLRNVPTMYWCPLKEAFVKGILRDEKQGLDFRSAFLEQFLISIIAVSFIVLEPFFYSWYYVLIYFFTALTDYDNHAGCDNSQYGFSNSTTNQCYNWVRNNFGYHTAHHYFPDAHWTTLPRLHEEIKEHIPIERIQNRWWTGLYTPPLLVYWLFAILQGTNRALHTQQTIERLTHENGTD